MGMKCGSNEPLPEFKGVTDNGYSDGVHSDRIGHIARVLIVGFRLRLQKTWGDLPIPPPDCQGMYLRSNHFEIDNLGKVDNQWTWFAPLSQIASR